MISMAGLLSSRETCDPFRKLRVPVVFWQFQGIACGIFWIDQNVDERSRGVFFWARSKAVTPEVVRVPRVGIGPLGFDIVPIIDARNLRVSSLLPFSLYVCHDGYHPSPLFLQFACVCLPQFDKKKSKVNTGSEHNDKTQNRQSVRCHRRFLLHHTEARQKNLHEKFPCGEPLQQELWCAP